MITDDVLAFVAQCFNLKSKYLRTGSNQIKENNSEIDIWVKLFYVATAWTDYDGQLSQWGIAVVHSKEQILGMKFNWGFKTSFYSQIDEHGNRVKVHNPTKNKYECFSPIVVKLVDWQDPVQEALRSINLIATSDTTLFGDAFGFHLYISADGGAKTRILYSEEGYVDPSIERLWQAIGKTAGQIRILSENENNS